MTCTTCDGKGYIAYPTTHPTNPNMDGWERRPCGCKDDIMAEVVPASVITVDEMRAWYDRMYQAIHENEPLYVTPEEYADIKRRFRGAPLPPATYPTAVPAAFLGTPVIIDAEKAAQQRGTS